MRFRLVALIVAVLCGLTACTSDAPTDPPSTSGPAVLTPPNTSPISTSAPITSSSTTPTPAVPTTGPNTRPGEKPPTLPDLATHHSPVGAAEFARFWFRALDWGYATTNSTLARSLFSKDTCSGCERFLTTIIDRNARLHRHFQGGRISVTQIAFDKGKPLLGASIAYDVKADQAALEIRDSTGRVVERTSATPGALFRTDLGWRGGKWTVINWRQAA